jgi:hypothetical protein
MIPLRIEGRGIAEGLEEFLVRGVGIDTGTRTVSYIDLE